MEPMAIAASAIALLTPYMKKAAEEFAGEAGKAVAEKAKNLFAMLKKSFSDDTAANDTIKRFEKSPERYELYLQDVLKEKIDRNPAFRNALSNLLQEIKETGPELKVVQMMKNAEDVVGLKANRMTRGKAIVEQEIEEGKNITGMEIDEIG